MTNAPAQVLESVLYAADLDAAERFYGDVLGLERVAGTVPRVLSRGPGTVLVFRRHRRWRKQSGPTDPAAWRNAPAICFAADAAELVVGPNSASSTFIGLTSNGRRAATRLCPTPPATASICQAASGGRRQAAWFRATNWCGHPQSRQAQPNRGCCRSRHRHGFGSGAQSGRAGGDRLDLCGQCDQGPGRGGGEQPAGACRCSS